LRFLRPSSHEHGSRTQRSLGQRDTDEANEADVKGIQIKSAAQIAKLREANLVVAQVLDVLAAAAAPGVSTWELDQLAAKHLKHLRAEPAFLGYRGYPAVLCASVNNIIVHGIPRKDVVLKDGDILSLDFGAFKDGWCGDSARTLEIGRVSPQAHALVEATRESLDKALAQCVRWASVGGCELGGSESCRGAWLFRGTAVRRTWYRAAHA
jgi:methionine aminopeptidase